MNLDQMKELVNNSPASMFTKEDVIKLVNSLEVNTTKSDKEHATLFLGFLKAFLENNDLDFEIDYDSAELDLDYNNKVSVNSISVSLDVDNFMSSFKYAVDDAIDNA